MSKYTSTHTKKWKLQQTYTQLPSDFYTHSNPQKVSAPKIVIFNESLLTELELEDIKENEKELTEVLAGNSLPEDALPLAQAYAGHQFGYFTMLGDGRALLLGERITSSGKRFDIQLKGAGRTAYSRSGDGRGTLHAMLREYMMSEALHALDIPTSRSLAVVATGDDVRRETNLPGGILTRISESHLRVGTFEYARRFVGNEGLEALLAYSLDRHFPKLKSTEHPALSFLKKVQDLQIDLIVNWMRVGFIHGVMNTDNMSIPGITIDYGPCAFMNSYDPNTVFSSIDTQARYKYSNQPKIAQWNLSCLAGALLPLMHKNEKIAIDMAEQVLNSFPSIYEAKWLEMMLHKLGLFEELDEDEQLVQDLLDWMKATGADYTNTFIDLQEGDFAEDKYQQEPFLQWKSKWTNRIDQQKESKEDALKLMRKNNPIVIPRNHIVEKALDEAANNNDFSFYKTFMEVLKSPYKKQKGLENYQKPPEDGDLGYQTFCGT